MSADNGVYILATPDDLKGHEYRVALQQCIGNICFDPNTHSIYPDEKTYNDGYDYSFGNPRRIVEYFGHCKVFETKAAALQEAADIYSSVEWTEYGISIIDLERPFAWYIEQEKIQPIDPQDKEDS